MSEADPVAEDEPTKTANGVGLQEDTVQEAICGRHVVEGSCVTTVERGDGKKVELKVEEGKKKFEVERKVGDKKVEVQEKKVQEEKKADDVKLPVGDVKMVVVEHVEVAEVADAKMAEPEDMNVAEVEDEKIAEAGVAKVVGLEEAKLVETENMKMMEDEDQKVVAEGKGKEGKEEEENDLMEEKDNVNVKNKEQKGLKKYRRERKNDEEKEDAKDENEGGTKADELLNTPAVSSIDRPVRDRRFVERFVDALEKEPVKKFLIEKGRGTPLKEIPNVAYKLAKKKPVDLKFLHQILFGRPGKATDIKNHILQFSGFVWHGDEETQKTKIKEKLDKCLKDALAYLCYLLDVHFLKATARKEDLVAMLLDFLEAPHATTDVILSEKDLSMNTRKRKKVAKGNASKISRGRPAKRSRKRSKSEDSMQTEGGSGPETEDEEEQKDEENSVSDEDNDIRHSKAEENENGCEEIAEDEDDEEDSGKNKKKFSRKEGSAGVKSSKLMTGPIKSSSPRSMKNPTKTSSKASKAEESDLEGAKVFSRKKIVDVSKKKSTPKADQKEKITGKKQITRRARSKKEESGPSKEELRSTICNILNKVDFNTATFSDVLKELATYYNMDLTPRKAAIKFMIQEELTKQADEAEENEEDEEDEAGADEDENPKSMGNKVEN